MNRQEKINLLNAIKEGKINRDCLRPTRIFVFHEIDSKPGFFDLNGKEYSEEEVDVFSRSISGSVGWDEKEGKFKEDVIIRVVYE